MSTAQEHPNVSLLQQQGTPQQAPAQPQQPQQQQQQQQQQPQQGATPSSPSSGGEVLQCQWQNCGERFPSAETLYDHVCELHVGRKSTNNLNLQCQWASCRTSTVKRDHITSHIRVHVPLKPHKCDFCGKCFKRPQDLKKHVKTHADDSVLRGPGNDAGMRQGQGPNGGFHPGGAKDFYPGGPGAMQNGSPYAYQGPTPNMHYAGGPAGNGHAMHQQYGAYYPAPQTAGFGMSEPLTESRKRGFDALNDFFRDVKRQQFESSQYMDLNARLGGFHNIVPFGYQPGYGGNMGMGGMSDDYGHGGTAAMYAQGPQPAYQYALPEFSELKTKNDLMSIDHFLEQLQRTVYDTHVPQTTHNSAIQPNLESAARGSPSLDTSISSHGTPAYSASNAGSVMDDASTPGMTPSSSTFGQSPGSVHSSAAVGSRSQGSLYPSLPPVASMTDAQSGHYAQQGGVSSGLGDFGEDTRRRYSGGMLQRANRPSPPTTEILVDPKIEEGEKGKTLEAEAEAETKTSRPSSRGEKSLEPEEVHKQNLEFIKFLRGEIQKRIERGDFEGSDADESMKRDGSTTPRPTNRDEDVEMTDRERETGSLYPVLKAVEESR